VFGRRVKRSAYTRYATAIGLAIQADAQAGYVLRDKFTRHFGVWREADAGRTVVFDPLFSKGTQLPAPGEPPLVQSRQYTPVHNIGHFRYLECSHRTDEGCPAGDITVWDDIRFAFDPALRNNSDLPRHRITPYSPKQTKYNLDEWPGPASFLPWIIRDPNCHILRLRGRSVRCREHPR